MKKSLLFCSFIFLIITNNSKAMNFEEDLVEENSSEVVSNEVISVKRSELKSLKVSVEEGQEEIFEAAAVAFHEIYNSETPAIQESALKLLKALAKEDFEKLFEMPHRVLVGKDFKIVSINANDVALRGIKSTDSLVKESALKLFKVLVERDLFGRTFKDAKDAALQGTESTDRFVKELALKLLKTLVKKDFEMVFEDAIIVVLQEIKNPDTPVKELALKLFKALVEKGFLPDVFNGVSRDNLRVALAESKETNRSETSEKMSKLKLIKTLIEERCFALARI